MSQRTIFYSLIGCAIFAIGLMIGNANVQIGEFKFTKELSLLHGISIVITVLSALLISVVLDKQKDRTKGKRELILKSSNELYKEFENLHEIISTDGKIDHSSVHAAVKSIVLAFARYSRMLNLSKVKMTSKLEDYYSKHRLLRGLVSEGSKGEVTVLKNQVKFTPDRITEIETFISDIKGLLLEDQMGLLD